MEEITKFIEDADLIRIQIEGNGLSMASKPGIPMTLRYNDNMVLCAGSMSVRIEEKEIKSITRKSNAIIILLKNKIKLKFKK